MRALLTTLLALAFASCAWAQPYSGSDTAPLRILQDGIPACTGPPNVNGADLNAIQGSCPGSNCGTCYITLQAHGCPALQNCKASMPNGAVFYDNFGNAYTIAPGGNPVSTFTALKFTDSAVSSTAAIDNVNAWFVNNNNWSGSGARQIAGRFGATLGPSPDGNLAILVDAGDVSLAAGSRLIFGNAALQKIAWAGAGNAAIYGVVQNVLGGLNFNWGNVVPRMQFDATGAVMFFTGSTGANDNSIGLGGDADRQIGLERNSIAGQPGHVLFVSAGGAAVGAVDKAGGAAGLIGGRSTGDGGSDAQVNVAFTGQGAGSTYRLSLPVWHWPNGHPTSFIDLGGASVAACGTSPAIAGSDAVGKITVGTGGVTTCDLVFLRTWTNAPHCIIDNQTHTLAAAFTMRAVPDAATTTTKVTIQTSLADISGDTLRYTCASAE